MMTAVQTKDHYKTLGVAESATHDEIKKSYRKLAKRFHPDATGGDKAKESKFKEISEAYETLGDEKKRAEFDMLRKSPFPRAGGGYEGGNPYAGGNPFAGYRGGGGGRTRVEVRDMGDLFGGGARGKEKAGGFSDLFSQFFGGAPGEMGDAGPEAMRGSDVKAKVEVDLPTAALGGQLPIMVDGKRLVVKVPWGIEDGQVIRIAGQGQASPGGYSGPAGAAMPGGAGDLLLEVHVRPHEKFRRHGHSDLEVDVPVPLDVAVLGGKVEVPTLEKPVQLTVPAGSSSGVKLRLKGKGARVRGKELRGDLFAVLQVTVPKEIPERAKELIKEFARLTAITPAGPAPSGSSPASGASGPPPAAPGPASTASPPAPDSAKK